MWLRPAAVLLNLLLALSRAGEREAISCTNQETLPTPPPPTLSLWTEISTLFLPIFTSHSPSSPCRVSPPPPHLRLPFIYLKTTFIIPITCYLFICRPVPSKDVAWSPVLTSPRPPPQLSPYRFNDNTAAAAVTLAAVAKPANIADSYPPGDYGNPTKNSGYPSLEPGSVSSGVNNELYDEESYDQQETFAYYDEGEDKIVQSNETPEALGTPGLAGAPGAPAPGDPGAVGHALDAPGHYGAIFPDNTGKELFVLFYTVNIFKIVS
jgi:hypothetical protein